MKNIRTVVVDDEPLALEGITNLLRAERDITIIGTCGDGEKAVALIEKQRPDLVFLDVQMPELDGFGVLEALDSHTLPIIVFVTAYDRYALRAFDVHAVDYVLKPIDAERFSETLRRARQRLALKESNGLDRELKGLVEELKSRNRRFDRVVVKSGSKILFIKTDDIDWIEASGDYVKLHIGKNEHTIRGRISELESRLDAAQFLRIHRSTIVNLNCIKEMQPIFYGDYSVILQNGQRLTLSRTYREKLSTLLDKEV